MLIVTNLAKSCPHAEGTNRHTKWKHLREGIAVADYVKMDPLCDLTYLRKMAKRNLLTLVDTAEAAKPAAKPPKAAKPEAPKAEVAPPAKPAKAAKKK